MVWLGGVPGGCIPGTQPRPWTLDLVLDLVLDLAPACLRLVLRPVSKNLISQIYRFIGTCIDF